MARVFFVFLTDPFHKLKARAPADGVTGSPWFRVCAGVIDRDFVFEGLGISARISLNEMSSFGLRMAGLVQPGFSIESGNVHDEGFALITPHGIA